MHMSSFPTVEKKRELGPTCCCLHHGINMTHAMGWEVEGGGRRIDDMYGCVDEKNNVNVLNTAAAGAAFVSTDPGSG